MTNFDRVVLFGALGAIWMMAYIANKNAVEAHRHAHELGCYVGADDLCLYYEAQK